MFRFKGMRMLEWRKLCSEDLHNFTVHLRLIKFVYLGSLVTNKNMSEEINRTVQHANK